MGDMTAGDVKQLALQLVEVIPRLYDAYSEAVPRNADGNVDENVLWARQRDLGRKIEALNEASATLHLLADKMECHDGR